MILPGDIRAGTRCPPAPGYSTLRPMIALQRLGKKLPALVLVPLLLVSGAVAPVLDRELYGDFPVLEARARKVRHRPRPHPLRPCRRRIPGPHPRHRSPPRLGARASSPLTDPPSDPVRIGAEPAPSQGSSSSDLKPRRLRASPPGERGTDRAGCAGTGDIAPVLRKSVVQSHRRDESPGPSEAIGEWSERRP